MSAIFAGLFRFCTFGWKNEKKKKQERIRSLYKIILIKNPSYVSSSILKKIRVFYSIIV